MTPFQHAFRRAVRPYRAAWRREQGALAAQYASFLGDRGPALRAELAAMPASRTALVVGYDNVKLATFQTPLLFSLRMAGYRVVVLAPTSIGATADFYRTIGAAEVAGIEDIEVAHQASDAVQRAACPDQQALLDLDYDGVNIGRFVVSTLMRRLRKGSIDPAQPDVASLLGPAIAASVRAVATARAVVGRYKPDLVCFYDRGYTPDGELFDVALAAGAQATTLNAAHRSGFVIAKRYGDHNRDRHFAAPSPSFWRGLQAMAWEDAKWQALSNEIERSYRNGSWYDEVGTQFNKRVVGKDRIAAELNLDPARKVAVVFPHLFWDATFFWGEDLFADYKDWFCQTIKAAAANDRLNWVIKIHPAGVVKDARDGYRGESSEMVAIRETLGGLPDHIKLIPPDSKISTFSLFDVMDYCITVRGTIGIEAAIFGATVLTAGTGRYDGYGFTDDSASRGEYLHKLARIETIPRPSAAQVELARRYAYGLFLLRPLKLDVVRFRYLHDSSASLQTVLGIDGGEKLTSHSDLMAMADWLGSSDEEDLVGRWLNAPEDALARV